MKVNLRGFLKDIPMVVLGNLCIAIAVVFFVIPNKILVGGTAGVSVVLNAFFGFNEEIMIKILTYLLFIIGAVVLGKSFTLKTLTSAIVYPILLTIVSAIFKVIPRDFFQVGTLIATICSGALVGLGIGLVYRRNGSTGGMDIIPLIINKYTNIPLHILLLIVDGITVLLGAIAYGFEASIYGVISVWICSYIINQAMLIGTQKLKQVYIISKNLDEINSAVTKELDRGSTIIKAEGGYTKEQFDMLMVVLTINQYPDLIELIHLIDPTAFVIVYDINEVKGRGFTI